MYNNPYYNPMQGFNQSQRIQPIDYANQSLNNNTYIPPMQASNNQLNLLGKSVDSIDVVKAIDIPFDGSTSYFPLTDGSAIVTKKLQNDGKSKITIYKPIEEDNIETPKYVTTDDLKKAIDDIDLSGIDKLEDKFQDLKDEIRDLKKNKKKED